MSQFPTLLRHWRKQRRLSQLDLALDANVSARHLSFLETGRAQPSPGMILQLSDALDLPLDARNALFVATGYAPRYPSRPLTDDAMAPVLSAVRRMLDTHAPYPGLAMDRLWTIQMMNPAARMLFAPLGMQEGASLLDLFRNPLMPQIVENWPQVAHHSATRLRAESLAAGGISDLEDAARALFELAERDSAPSDGPVIPVTYRLNDLRLSLFGTIAQFSTIADSTLDDLKIELFFPADEASAATLEALANA